MKIRRAVTTDSGRILELLVQVNNVHSEGRPDLFLKDKTKYTKEDLENIITSDSTPIFVAVDDSDRILGYGFCVFQSHDKEPNFPDITTLYIDDICVDENCRGQHVGQELYQYITAFAKESGCYNITLNVWEKNPDAKLFYEAQGLSIQKYGMEMIL